MPCWKLVQSSLVWCLWSCDVKYICFMVPVCFNVLCLIILSETYFSFLCLYFLYIKIDIVFLRNILLMFGWKIHLGGGCMCCWRQMIVNKRWKAQKHQCLISFHCSPHQCLFILLNTWDMKEESCLPPPPPFLSLSRSIIHTDAYFSRTLFPFFEPQKLASHLNYKTVAFTCSVAIVTRWWLMLTWKDMLPFSERLHYDFSEFRHHEIKLTGSLQISVICLFFLNQVMLCFRDAYEIQNL